MDIITHNPYRYLGVYSNSPTKERIANKAKINAYLKVGKPISFPLDFPEFLPRIERAVDSIRKAESELTLPMGQIKYAQFWWMKSTPMDEIAFNHLLDGNAKMAMTIWEKKDNTSSLQNRFLLSTINRKWSAAIKYAEVLYTHYSDEFTTSVTGDAISITSPLWQTFIDTYLEIGVATTDLLKELNNEEWKDYLEEKLVAPLINIILKFVDLSKTTRGKGSVARLKSGQKLMSSTRKPLSQLEKYLPTTDIRYQTIADKLATEILQCGIDYYNASDDDNRAIRSMELQKYAQSIAIGKVAKDRCDDNVHILERIISRLPPLEVTTNHKTIQSYLISFATQPVLIKYSIQLIRDCEPHLVEIKEKLGKNHKYYLKTSTIIVNNALGNVIEEVNEALNTDLETLKSTLISAWRTQLYMDKFDLEPEYKEGRYKECRETLHEIISQRKGFQGMYFMHKYHNGWCENLDTSDIDLRTEQEYYQSCCDITSYKSYLQKFPSGNYVTEAKLKIELLTFQAAKTVAALEEFIIDYPNSKLVAKAQQELIRARKEEYEQKERTERQERLILACHTIAEVIFLTTKEENNKIDMDKCSIRAFELANSEEDYHKVMAFFGVRTTGGEKAKSRLDEIERKKKEALKSKNKVIKWSLIVIIPILSLLGIYLFWGLGGLSITCYILTAIFAFIAFGGLSTIEVNGCIIGVISGGIALALGILGSYLGDLHKEEKQEYTEEVTSYIGENSNKYTANNYTSRSATNYIDNKESSNIDPDYKTYINNHLATGSNPYKNYYQSRTGDNYLDVKTSGSDYVIIVRDYSSSEVVNHIYIRAGETGRLYLPNGTYNIFFYGGKGWNPKMKNKNVIGGFISNAHIQKDGPVELYNQYGEYTLYPVRNGNLQLQASSLSEAL